MKTITTALTLVIVLSAGCSETKEDLSNLNNNNSQQPVEGQDCDTVECIGPNENSISQFNYFLRDDGEECESYQVRIIDYCNTFERGEQIRIVKFIGLPEVVSFDCEAENPEFETSYIKIPIENMAFVGDGQIPRFENIYWVGFYGSPRPFEELNHTMIVSIRKLEGKSVIAGGHDILIDNISSRRIEEVYMENRCLEIDIPNDFNALQNTSKECGLELSDEEYKNIYIGNDREEVCN